MHAKPWHAPHSISNGRPSYFEVCVAVHGWVDMRATRPGASRISDEGAAERRKWMRICSGTAALALCAGTVRCRVMIPLRADGQGLLVEATWRLPPKAALLASQQQMTPHDVLCATKPQSSASLSAVAQGKCGRCGHSGDTVWPSLAPAVSAVALPSSLQGPFFPCPARSSSPPCPRLLLLILLILSLSPAHLFPLQGASRAWWMVVSRTWPQECGNEGVRECRSRREWPNEAPIGLSEDQQDR